MKALVVGGSSGIGLSIVLQLLQDSSVETVFVMDKSAFPKEYAHEKVSFIECDLAKGDYLVLEQADDVQMLYITAGFGHLMWFQDLSDTYINDSFSVNAVAPIQIISHYYSRIMSVDDFYCAVMVSIAARLSSPLFSVYSAAKAALSKFIEAVNVELDVQGSRNRILEVSPGSLKGTSFTGGVSRPEYTADLAKRIIERSRNREELFIPQYDDVYKGVLARYANDAHRFGVESYEYKKKQGRLPK
ncbi:MAG: SDR family NAD(P)-dependent oxidoreductase [Bacteroidales bacterium]|nr:SDR family NAD(P)-dependent oxidoreductase [Bacteroidales bacterium]